MLVITVSAFGQATLNVEPRFASLGSFAAQDPGSNSLNPGTTVLKINSRDPWAAYVTLVQPARRLSDNLELPIERIRQLFPDMADLCNGLPVRLDYGPGSAEDQTVSYDWQPVQSRIAQYLEPADPPGVYRFIVRMELQDRDGQEISNRVALTTEFSIQPHVAVELSDPSFRFTVEHPGEPQESDPVYIRILANTSWTLDLTWTGDLVQNGTDFHIDWSRISWMTGTGDEWESLLPAYVPVSLAAVTAARGNAPAPFTLTDISIPLQLQVQSDRTTIGGTYESGLRAVIHTEGLAR